MRKVLIALLFAVGVSSAFAQAGACRYDHVMTKQNGALVPVSKASITVYVSGTTTKATLYDNENLTGTPLTNPVSVDANGEYSYCAALGTTVIEVVGGSGIATKTGKPVTLGYLDTDAVHKSGVETITGSKTFTGTNTPPVQSTNTATDGNAQRGGITKCVHGANGTKCYGGLSIVQDMPGHTGWNHSVGFEAQVWQPNPLGVGDIYGMVAGIKAPAGTWPGWGIRAEFSDPDNFPGIFTTGIGTVDGVALIGYQSGASCRTGTCNSQPIQAHGMLAGVASADGGFVVDAWGNAYILVDAASSFYLPPNSKFTGSSEIRPMCSSGPCSSNSLAIISRDAGGNPLTTFVQQDEWGNVGVTTPSPSALFGISGKLKVASGVDSTGAGIKHKRFTSSDAVGYVMCQTGSTIGATCNNVFNVPGSAFADTNYTVACSVAGSATGVPVVQQAVATTTSTFTVTIAALTAAGAQASYVGCALVHD